jgi:hypothetical protein
MRSAIHDHVTRRTIRLCVTANYKYPFIFKAIRAAATRRWHSMPQRSQAHFRRWLDAGMVDVLRQCRYRQ